ncbi:MAG: DUF4150 domain-containing protein [Methyloprofundus sp.]|nr:DUF4150 domain-containing protein [Methyloprofundus sp.]
MANDVFANGRELSCKAGSGKTICSFPDVCFTPPQTPATPPGIPIPYPNTGFASDTTKGSKKVKISRKEVMLKNKSYYKKSTGDETGCASKKGLISSKNRGKVYFQSWSMDVKIEGKNVDRHLDITTNNHGSLPGNTPPWPFLDSMAIGTSGKAENSCAGDKAKQETACEGQDPCPGALGKKKERNATWASDASDEANGKPCVKARRCELVPYKPDSCCPGQTAHHVIPKSSFYTTTVKAKDKLTEYNPRKAPCMCLEGTTNTHGDHGLAHTAHAARGADAKMIKNELSPFDDHVKVCAQSVRDVAPHCDQKCLEEQITQGHVAAGVKGNPKIKHKPSGRTNADAQKKARYEIDHRAESVTNKKII